MADNISSWILDGAPEWFRAGLRPPAPDPWRDGFDNMKQVRRWLLARADKVPFYVNGKKRHGMLDGPEDLAQLVTYEEAKVALMSKPKGWLLGFALGPDGTGQAWQGIDFDKVRANQLGHLANAVVGYVELSPSEEGAHAIGYGRPFATLGSNSSGIEAYASGRYFTVTENLIRDDELICLADYVEQVLAPRHNAGQSGPAVSAQQMAVDPRVVTELRSALAHLRADDRDQWIAVGHALKELGEVGRGLWLEWSRSSEKHNPTVDPKKWDTFKPSNTGYQAIFKRAADQGWVNPASKAAQIDPVALHPSSAPAITLEFAMSSDTATIRLEYLDDPFLPAKCVVGFYGRGSTSKSSFLATLAAHISHYASTLWVSVEEPPDWIKVRHIKSGGREQTLMVVKAVASKIDGQGRVIASSFNVYEHLESAVTEALKGFAAALKPALRLVVLDTAVGLTGWAKGETPNDDAAVKKLLGFLQALAERHDLTIAIIGHANKGKHEHFADTVMGATAWTNSPRLSFVHAADVREDFAYVMRVAKTNFNPFGVTYTTEPVHTLYERANGPDTVLVRVVPGEIVWGESASMEMFVEATKKQPDDDEEGGSARRGPSLVENVIQCIVETVHSTGQPVTRDFVHDRLGRQVSRRDWVKVDERLSLAMLQYRVAVDKEAPNNRVTYRKVA